MSMTTTPKAPKRAPVYGYSTTIPHDLGAAYVVQVIVSRDDGEALSARELATLERAYPQPKAAAPKARKTAAPKRAAAKSARTAKR